MGRFSTVSGLGAVAVQEHIHGDVGVEGYRIELIDVYSVRRIVADAIRPLKVNGHAVNLIDLEGEDIFHLDVREGVHRQRGIALGILPCHRPFGRRSLGGICIVVPRPNLDRGGMLANG